MYNMYIMSKWIRSQYFESFFQIKNNDLFCTGSLVITPLSFNHFSRHFHKDEDIMGSRFFKTNIDKRLEKSG